VARWLPIFRASADKTGANTPVILLSLCAIFKRPRAIAIQEESLYEESPNRKVQADKSLRHCSLHHQHWHIHSGMPRRWAAEASSGERRR
jgi:hypothetical protein